MNRIKFVAKKLDRMGMKYEYLETVGAACYR